MGGAAKRTRWITGVSVRRALARKARRILLSAHCSPRSQGPTAVTANGRNSAWRASIRRGRAICLRSPVSGGHVYTHANPAGLSSTPRCSRPRVTGTPGLTDTTSWLPPSGSMKLRRRSEPMSVTAPSLAPSATRRRRTSRNAASLAALSAKWSKAPALEHRLLAWRLNPRDLKWMKDSVRPHFDEGVAQTLLLEIDRHARSEDPLVETDQSVHVGGDKRQVVDVVEQLHDDLPHSGVAHNRAARSVHRGRTAPTAAACYGGCAPIATPPSTGAGCFGWRTGGGRCAYS